LFKQSLSGNLIQIKKKMENEIYLFLKSIDQLEYFEIITEKGGFKTFSSFEGISEKELDEFFKKKIGVSKLLCRKSIIKSILKKISENTNNINNNVLNIVENLVSTPQTSQTSQNSFNISEFKNLKTSENQIKKLKISENENLNFKDYFNSKCFSDVIVRIISKKRGIEKDFFLHKIILSNQSEYFKTLFTGNFIEKNLSTIDIDFKEEEENFFDEIF
jgi:hypothetical protein